MYELSVFIDESGDFGPYECHAPYYIITLVFHNQGNDISEQVSHLRRHVVEQGFVNATPSIPRR
jgi:alkylhydroperoxidase family enzyme